jgi:monovalent cation:H+ antiporter-2, CPA2 family
MHDDHSLISTIAVGLGFAFIGGLIASRLKLPPLIGYLLAGIAVGPFTPGFVADVKLAPQLAEIGVILLMFGVGMHFSLADLWAVKRYAVPGAVLQMVLATLMGIGVTMLWGWSLGSGLVFGLALSVASTVVLLKALEANGLLTTGDGRIAVGWLVVEDLMMVLALVLLPAFAGLLGAKNAVEPAGGVWQAVGVTLLKVAAFIAVIIVVGRQAFPWLLSRVVRTESQELFTLAAIALSLGVAVGAAELFGVSYALGAFFAGLVLPDSDHSHRAAKDLRPLQDIFAALFFVSVGMLLDPAILLQQPLRVLLVVLIIVFGKSLVAYGLVRGLRGSHRTAFTVSVALAQIGEFSFILAALGQHLGLLPAEGLSLLVAGALFSITINPFLFQLIGKESESASATSKRQDDPAIKPL